MIKSPGSSKCATASVQSCCGPGSVRLIRRPPPLLLAWRTPCACDPRRPKAPEMPSRRPAAPEVSRRPKAPDAEIHDARERQKRKKPPRRPAPRGMGTVRIGGFAWRARRWTRDGSGFAKHGTPVVGRSGEIPRGTRPGASRKRAMAGKGQKLRELNILWCRPGIPALSACTKCGTPARSFAYDLDGAQIRGR